MPLKLAPRDAAVSLFFLLAVVVYDAPLTLQGRVLASFDTQVYFYPNATFLASRLRSGQVPLWDPYLFGGIPFLANSQVGALYPPHWLFVLGSVSTIYSILIVGHVWLLAVGTYLLARQTVGLSRWGGVFAGVALALSGFVGGMSGHLNQVESFAWLPLGILGLERAAHRRDWRWAVFAAIPFALSALAGHSQVLFLTALLAVTVALTRVVALWRDERQKSRLKSRTMVSDCARLATGPILGILLSAAQLVPTIELTRLSIRSHGLSFADAAAFSLPPHRLISALLPSIDQQPPSTEWFGWVGLSCLLLAGLGVWRQPNRTTFAIALLAMVGLLVSLGQFTPVYGLAYGVLPGVRLYRVPARWLEYWVLAAAILGGIGLDSVVKGRPLAPSGSSTLVGRSRPWVLAGLALAIFVAAGVGYKFRAVIAWPSPATLGFWVLVIAGLLTATRPRNRFRWLVAPALIAVLVLELEVTSHYMPQADAVWARSVEVPGNTVNILRSLGKGDRVLALGDNSYDPGDLRSIRSQISATLPSGAVTQYITSIKHVDGLTPNLPLQFGLSTLDGYDGGILPLDRYHDLKAIFPNQGRDVSDGRLRLQLVSPPPAELLGWLNLRFLIMDRLRDRWIDGTYYDLALRHTLLPGESLDLPCQPRIDATSIGIVVENAVGVTPRGQLTVVLGTQQVSFDLEHNGGPQATSSDLFNAVPLAVWRTAWSSPVQVDRVQLSWSGSDSLVVRSVTLGGPAIDPERSVPVDPDFRLVYLGDMKIYDNQVLRPRAFLADGLAVVPGLDAVVGRLADPTWHAGASAIASSADIGQVASFGPTPGTGVAQMMVEEPERVVIATDSTSRKILVVTDSAYPGWLATIDGVPAPILTVDIMFRGIDLPAGRHVVELIYDPLSWRIGLALSAIGVVSFLGSLALTSGWRMRIDAVKNS